MFCFRLLALYFLMVIETRYLQLIEELGYLDRDDWHSVAYQTNHSKRLLSSAEREKFPILHGHVPVLARPQQRLSRQVMSGESRRPGSKDMQNVAI